jgi:hypothetical protein
MINPLDIIKPKDVLDYTLNFCATGLDADAQLRLLYLEARRNMALFEALDTKRPRDAAIIRVLEALETEYLRMVFQGGEKNRRVFSRIAGIDDFVYMDEYSGADDGGRLEEVNLLKVVAFIYVRLGAVRTLASMKASGPGFRKLNYAARMENIRNAYLTLIRCMEDAKPVRGLTLTRYAE